MAVLEVVVRPRVFPDIRPGDAEPARNDNPGFGRGIIGGGGGQVIDLQYSYRASTQKQHQSEEYRVFDIIRVYRVKPATQPNLLPPPNTPPGAVKPATRSAGIDYSLPLQPGERIDKSTWTDQEVMWQIMHVLHTGEIKRTVYKRPDSRDYPKGNMVVIEQDIIRKTKGPTNLVDLILP